MLDIAIGMLIGWCVAKMFPKDEEDRSEDGFIPPE